MYKTVITTCYIRLEKLEYEKQLSQQRSTMKKIGCKDEIDQTSKAGQFSDYTIAHENNLIFKSLSYYTVLEASAV